MDKSEIIKSVVDKVKAAGFTPSSVSKPDDSNVIAKFVDVKAPYMKISVVLTGEEIDMYNGKTGTEPIDPTGAKLEEVVRTRVQHAVRQLDSMRPVELAAEARRIAEGR